MTVVGGIRLVVLHTSQTTLDVSGAEEPNLLTGIAPALSAAGIPLVIGMQMALHTTAATRTSGIMYRALAGGASIQDAVSQARQALYVEEADRVAWAVPTLSIRSRDTGPAYLIQPPSLAPSFAATPATPPVTSQVIVARKKSMVRDVALQGGPGSDQFVRAVGQSAVERAKLQARHATTQHISAEDESAVTDVTLDDQRADPE